MPTKMTKTKTYRVWLVGVVLAGVLLLLPGPVASLAQNPGPGDQDQQYDQGQNDQAQSDQGQNGQDPPSVVGRMNFAEGSVSFQPGGEGDWVTAVPNRRLSSGDNLWTDENSRAELHVGST